MLAIVLVIASLSGPVLGIIDTNWSKDTSLLVFEQTSELLPTENPAAALRDLWQGSVASGTCEDFDKLGEDVEASIEGLLAVLGKFSLNLDSTGLDDLRAAGCSGSVEVTVSDAAGMPNWGI